MTLDNIDKKILCDIAREALTAAVAGKTYTPPAQERPALMEKRGCFVTIKTGGRLRGCIGCFTSTQPLHETIAEYTRLSALEDPRFTHNRIREAETAKAELDISVLSPLKNCDNPETIIPGIHGIFVARGEQSGCFLPQVATEMNWSAEEFWGHCCQDKAGLEWNAWRQPDTRLMTFTAEVFDCRSTDGKE